MIDDHYIATSDNKLIDTSAFESELKERYGALSSADLADAKPWPHIHDRIETIVSTPPVEPNDDQLICRYLSPIKFLWFMSQMEIFFGSASAFDDARDSAIPEDYNKCVQRFLMEKEVTSTTAWDEHIRRMRSRWLVSCWTEITDPDDDHLLLHKYAGGEHGVGITLRYGLLRELFQHEQKNDPDTERFFSGYVSYKQPLKIAPFNKRRIFRNEKEIRFVLQSATLTHKRIGIADLKSEIGLRISPEAPLSHHDAIRDAWLLFGGEDRIQVAGEGGT